MLLRLLLRTLPALLLALLAAPAPLLAETADITAAARGVVRVVIVARDGEAIFPVSHGTGFAVADELFVTNAHVVADMVNDPRLAIGIVPPEGGDAVFGRLVAVSPRNDLALIATTAPLNLPPLTIAGNPDATGAAVSAIGYPRNVEVAQGLTAADMFRAIPPLITTGFLSGSRPNREFDAVLHTASIAMGNSGGPLVDECGRVLGVNSRGTDGTAGEAEFFFAVSTRELLPFLREQNVQPQINALPCRSLAELEEAESDRAEQARARTAETAAERAATAEQLRRNLTQEVTDARIHLTALATLLLGVALAAGGTAVLAHRRGELRLRAQAGGGAAAALVLAVVALAFRPAWSGIDKRIDDALAARNAPAQGPATPPASASADGTRTLSCALDQERSRITSAPEQTIALTWSRDGCVNGRTQYGLDAGAWTRLRAPQEEAAVSVNRFDPASGEYVVERYLLDRTALLSAREARQAYEAPSCGGGEAAAQELGSAQAPLLAALPQRPNERLIYSCRDTAGAN